MGGCMHNECMQPSVLFTAPAAAYIPILAKAYATLDMNAAHSGDLREDDYDKDAHKSLIYFSIVTLQ